MGRRRVNQAAAPEAGSVDMATKSDALPEGQRRGAQALETLKDAYQALFSSQSNRAQAEIVLTDLAGYTGFFMVLERGAPESLLREQEGMRRVFARIHNFLHLTGDEARRLHEAARAEALINSQEGAL